MKDSTWPALMMIGTLAATIQDAITNIEVAVRQAPLAMQQQ